MTVPAIAFIPCEEGARFLEQIDINQQPFHNRALVSDRSFTSQVIQWTLWGITMSLVMGWLAKSRKAAAPRGNQRVLTVSKAATMLLAVCLLFFIALTALSAIFAKPNENWVPYFFLAFLLLTLLSLIDALSVRHELSEGGINYRGLYRRYPDVPWQQIKRATWKPTMKWLVVETYDGKVLRFSALLNGLETLAAALLDRVPSLQCDDTTVTVLTKARNGDLPTVWM